ncbi:MAG TPA: rhodanese-like domain-containing protein [Vicinamibacteria bacterium]|nr:rhodanese-like domain-containing protein [Vicinamibacteria bacterium]
MSSSEALGLVASGAVRVLDVRSPEEYAQLGHIPGSLLIPAPFVVSAPAVLEDGPPLLVCCEHGVRSRHAAALLSRAGLPGVLNLLGGMSVWPGPREMAEGRILGPSAWLLGNADLLPRRGRVLDVASGRGRHALLLGAMGLSVKAVDRDREALGALGGWAERLGVSLETEVLDLETDGGNLGQDAYALILVFRYLHRPLVPRLLAALAPGGVLLYETYTKDQAKRGCPTNPAFLLEPGELLSLMGGLEVLRHREGDFEEGCLASVAARRPLG